MIKSQAAPSRVIPVAFSAAPPVIGVLQFVTRKKTDGNLGISNPRATGHEAGWVFISIFKALTS